MACSFDANDNPWCIGISDIHLSYSCYFEFPEHSLREVTTACAQRVSLPRATDDPGHIVPEWRSFRRVISRDPSRETGSEESNGLTNDNKTDEIFPSMRMHFGTRTQRGKRSQCLHPSRFLALDRSDRFSLDMLINDRRASCARPESSCLRGSTWSVNLRNPMSIAVHRRPSVFFFPHPNRLVAHSSREEPRWVPP